MAAVELRSRLLLCVGLLAYDSQLKKSLLDAGALPILVQALRLPLTPPAAEAADAALAKDLRDLCRDCGVSQLARYALFREEVRDVETLEVVLEDDGWAELLLDAATRGTLRKAMGLLAAKAEADDAAFFWGDD